MGQAGNFLGGIAPGGFDSPYAPIDPPSPSFGMAPLSGQGVGGNLVDAISQAESAFPRLPKGLLTALASQESGGGRNTVGVRIDNPGSNHFGTRALGPFQFMPKTWVGEGHIGDPTNPYDAAMAAARKIDASLQRHGGVVQYALGDWYGHGQAPAGHPTTQQFVDQVMGRWQSGGGMAAPQPDRFGISQDGRSLSVNGVVVPSDNAAALLQSQKLLGRPGGLPTGFAPIGEADYRQMVQAAGTPNATFGGQLKNLGQSALSAIGTLPQGAAELLLYPYNSTVDPIKGETPIRTDNPGAALGGILGLDKQTLGNQAALASTRKMMNASTWDEFKTGVGEASPGGLAMLGVQGATSLLPVLGAGMVGGPWAAGAVGAGMSFGSNLDQQRQELLNLPESAWEQSPDYRALRAQGASHQAAVESLAWKGGMTAGVMSAPVGVADALLPGVGRAAGKALGAVSSRALRAAGQFGGGVLFESGQEGAEQKVANIGTNLGSGLNQDTDQGVLGNALIGGLVGGPTSMALGGFGARELPEVTPPPSPEPKFGGYLANPFAMPPPTEPSPPNGPTPAEVRNDLRWQRRNAYEFNTQPPGMAQDLFTGGYRPVITPTAAQEESPSVPTSSDGQGTLALFDRQAVQQALVAKEGEGVKLTVPQAKKWVAQLQQVASGNLTLDGLQEELSGSTLSPERAARVLSLFNSLQPEQTSQGEPHGRQETPVPAQETQQAGQTADEGQNTLLTPRSLAPTAKNRAARRAALQVEYEAQQQKQAQEEQAWQEHNTEMAPYGTNLDLFGRSPSAPSIVQAPAESDTNAPASDLVTKGLPGVRSRKQAAQDQRNRVLFKNRSQAVPIQETQNAEAVRSDAGQVRQGSPEGQPGVQRSPNQGGENLQRQSKEGRAETQQQEVGPKQQVETQPTTPEQAKAIVRWSSGENAQDHISVMSEYPSEGNRGQRIEWLQDAQRVMRKVARGEAPSDQVLNTGKSGKAHAEFVANIDQHLADETAAKNREAERSVRLAKQQADKSFDEDVAQTKKALSARNVVSKIVQGVVDVTPIDGLIDQMSTLHDANSLLSWLNSRNDKAFGPLVARLLALVGTNEIPVVWVKDGDEVPPSVAYELNVKQAYGASVYNAKSGKTRVFIRDGYASWEVVLHELVHAVSQAAIETDAEFAKQIDDIRRAVISSLFDMKGRIGDSRYEALRQMLPDPHEFLAAMSTNAELRGIMSRLGSDGRPFAQSNAPIIKANKKPVPAAPKSYSLFDRLIDVINKLLGRPLRKTELDRQRDAVQRILDYNKDQHDRIESLPDLLDRLLAKAASKIGEASLKEDAVTSAIRDVLPSAQQAADVVLDRASEVPTKIADFTLRNLATLGQFVDVAKAHLPAAEVFERVIRKMQAAANDVINRVLPITSRWGGLSAQERTALNTLLTESERDGMRPDLPFEHKANAWGTKTNFDTTEEARTAYAKLEAQYRALKDGGKLYREVMSESVTQLRGVVEAMKSGIRRSIHDPAERSKLLTALDRRYQAAVDGRPWNPHKRYGDYILVATDAKGAREVRGYATEREAKRIAAALRAQGYTAKVIKGDEHFSHLDGTDRSFINAMNEAIGKTVTDAKEAKKLTDAMRELYMASLPEVSGAKRLMPRKNIPGWNQDYRRPWAEAMTSMARYTAKLQHMDDLRDAAEDAGREAAKDKTVYAVATWTLDAGKTVKNMTVKFFTSAIAKSAYLDKLPGDVDYHVAIAHHAEIGDRVKSILRQHLSGEEADAQIKALEPEFKKQAERELKAVNDDPLQATRYYNLLKGRYDDFLTYRPNSPVANALTNLGFLNFLGWVPSFAFMNLTQVPMLTAPRLAARYRFGPATTALKNAYKLMGKNSGVLTQLAKNAWTKGGADTLDLSKFKGLSDGQTRLLDYLLSHGKLDFTQAAELHAVTEGTNETLARFMKSAGWLAHPSEVMNRVVTALATYELAMARSNALSPELRQQKAMEAAAEVLDTTQYDYSPENRPPILNHPMARVVLQFRQFAQQTAWQIGKAVYQALKSTDPQTRREQRAYLGYLLASTFLLAGVRGMPFAGAVLMLAAAMGDDGDDPEFKLRQQAKQDLGDTLGPLFSNGMFAMLGADVSRSIGLGDLIPGTAGGVRAEASRKDKLKNYLFDAAGPSISLMGGAGDAMDYFDKGDVLRGWEAMSPKALRVALHAYRLDTRGLENTNGVVRLGGETFTPWDLTLTAMGLKSETEAYKAAQAGAVQGKERFLDVRSALLKKQYWAAQENGDNEDVVKAQTRIDAFNDAHPESPIQMRDITGVARLKARAQAMAERTGGVATTRRQMRIADSLGLLDE